MATSEAYLARIILTRNGTDSLNEELMVGETLALQKKKKKNYDGSEMVPVSWSGLVMLGSVGFVLQMSTLWDQ